MQDFSGIGEKLVRAKENILDLEAEIATFFEKGEYPVLPEHDRKLLLEAIEYHRNRVIPRRFSVLAGEIIHHLRSCFDHIVWHFTVLPVKNIRHIEFPVLDKAPANHDGRKSFEGKIAGITDTNVRSLIEQLQPYKATDPLDDPLFIIHGFDIVDKHRELVLCTGTGARFVPIEMQGAVEAYQRQHPELDPEEVAYNLKGYGPLRPYVSFRDFGRREIQPVVPGLTDLFNYTVRTVKAFEAI